MTTAHQICSYCLWETKYIWLIYIREIKSFSWLSRPQYAWKLRTHLPIRVCCLTFTQPLARHGTSSSVVTHPRLAIRSLSTVASIAVASFANDEDFVVAIFQPRSCVLESGLIHLFFHPEQCFSLTNSSKPSKFLQNHTIRTGPLSCKCTHECVDFHCNLSLMNHTFHHFSTWICLISFLLHGENPDNWA